MRPQPAALGARCLALLCLLALALPARAAVELPRGAFHDTVADLSVKVPGGWVAVLRTWYDNPFNPQGESFGSSGGAPAGSGTGGGTLQASVNYERNWSFNRAWSDLRLIQETFGTGGASGSATGGLDGSTPSTGVQSIVRNGASYELRAGSETPLWSFGTRAWIVPHDGGYRWQNRSGEWIDYDSAGKMRTYGDAGGLTASLQRDGAGQITAILDRHARQVLSLSYDAEGHPQSLSDNRGSEPRRVSYHWSGGKLALVTDTLGNDWHYGYDSQGHLTRLTDPLGNSREVSYDDTGKTASVKDPLGRGVAYSYDYDSSTREYYVREDWTDGRVIESWYDFEGLLLRRVENGQTQSSLVKDGDRKRLTTDRRGHVTIREYDEWENLTRITYADGSSDSISYDYRFHLPAEHIDALGRHTRYEYDANGQLIRLTEAAGTPAERVTEYQYDADGNPIEIKRLGDAYTAEAVTRAEYDAYGDLTKLTGPEGAVSTFTYDNQGKALTRTDPNGHTWHYSYDLRGDLTGVTDPDGHSVSLQYDPAGHLQGMSDAPDRTVSLAYDVAGRPTRVTDREGHTSQLSYDLAGRITQTMDPLGNSQTLTYDGLGELSSYTDAAGDISTLAYGLGKGQGGGVSGDTLYPGLVNRIQYPTFLQTFDYDQRDRLTGVINHLSESEAQIIRVVYDAVGNRTSSTDAAGRTTQFGYDALNRLIEIIDSAGQSTSFAYDDRNNLLTITDRNGHTTHYAYDRANRRIQETRPGGQSWSYSYDPAGQLLSTVDPDGRRSENAYDKDGRLIAQRFYAAGAKDPERSVAYSYDRNGNVTGWSDGTTSASYQYDKNNRVIEASTDYGVFSLTYGYSYDAAGRPHNYLAPDGVEVAYVWDKARLSRIDLPGQGSITVNSYHWSHPEQITYPGGAKRSLGYDPLMRLTRIQVQDPAEQTVMDEQYRYDARGKLSERHTEHGDYSYQYDGLERLTQAKGPEETEGWAYDPNGNRIQDLLKPGSWSYDENDRLVESPLGSYRYDAAGHTIETSENGQTTRRIYNAEGRLARAEDSSGSAIGEYRYDPFGRRISKTTAAGTEYFHYTGAGLAGEYGASGTPLRQYGYWPGVSWGTNPVFQRTAQGYAFYQNDRLGTPQRLMTPNGASVWSGRYRAFGALAQQQGAGWTNPLRLPGQYADAETGWYQNYFRDYEPELGRYAQSDPLGLSVGLNPYLYVYGNPLLYGDPYGLFSPFDPATWPMFPQWTVDYAAGTGDRVSSLITGGLYSTADLRARLGIDGVVDKCSAAYRAGQWTGLAIFLVGTAGIGADALAAEALVDEGVLLEGVLDEELLAGEELAVAEEELGVAEGEVAATEDLGGLCFVAGTFVHTKEGLKPIEDIQVGDRVASKDEVTGETAWKPVVKLFRNHEKRILNITLVDADGEDESIGVTEAHPFWVEGRGWTAAGDLQEGYEISDVGGSTLAVKAVAREKRLQDTYNFEVADYHTYFVGRQGAWVHNACSVPKDAPIMLGENMKRVQAYADKVGGQTINDFIPSDKWSREANEAWIKQMKNEGRTLIDTGPDFARRAKRLEQGIRPDAPAYNLERMEAKGYSGYESVFERTGKYSGGVKGLDY